MHTYIVLKQGRDDSTLSSLRAYIQPEYTHNQNGSTHLLLRHPILHLNITSSRYTSKCMYTSTFLRARLDLNVFLPARVRAFFVIRVFT